MFWGVRVRELPITINKLLGLTSPCETAGGKRKDFAAKTCAKASKETITIARRCPGGRERVDEKAAMKLRWK
ncbi:MAG: hypothetical protein WB662_14655 [Methyloceanibacter sp.]|jgi:hypothetical protein